MVHGACFCTAMQIHHTKTTIALVVVFLSIVQIKTRDLCSKNYNFVSSDGESDNHNSTFYKYRNAQPQNCGSCTNPSFCLRKCCAVGFHAIKGMCLQNQNDRDFVVQLYKGKNPVGNVSVQDGILVGVMSCDFFALIPERRPDKDWMFLQEDGTLWTQTGIKSNDRYCVDYLKGYENLAALVCYGDETLRRINTLGMIISMPFLLATFIAYALLPDRNLHMKALMSYVLNLMLAYLLLVIIQLSENQVELTLCTTLGYFVLFFFMVSFYWMNVICIDIWFAFSNMRMAGIKSKSSEKKRFLIYCVYAWGMSIIHVLIVYTLQSVSDVNKWYNPSVGDGQCFLKRQWAELLYFYGPMAVIITINITLFATTAVKIRKIKKDTSVLKQGDSKRHSYENDKQTFNLYVKLLFAMGINWTMEILSWAVDWGTGQERQELWYVTDFCNAIYGVFIFFIFVFKRSIWKMLKKRYYSFMGKPYLAHSMTQNPSSTRVTNYSTTVTSIHDSNRTSGDGPMLTTSEA